MLILAWKYCEKENMQSVLLKIFELVTIDSLSKRNDYLWFKKYLLNSNIWFENVNKNDKNTIVFDIIVGKIYKEINNQRLHLKTQIENIIKRESNAWNEICSIKEVGISTNLRQDSLKCNSPEYTSYDLLSMNNNDVTFDCEKEYDSKIYLTKLLINARSLDKQFQEEMEAFVLWLENPYAKYQSANVKQMQRCLIKSQTVELFILCLLNTSILVLYFILFVFNIYYIIYRIIKMLNPQEQLKLLI